LPKKRDQGIGLNGSVKNGIVAVFILARKPGPEVADQLGVWPF